LLSFCFVCVYVRCSSFTMTDGRLMTTLSDVLGPISSDVEAKIQGTFTFLPHDTML